MSKEQHFPDVIECASNIKFFIIWLETSQGTFEDKQDSHKFKSIITRKGCINKANIAGFELKDAQIITFMSLIESFLKNQLNTSKETKLLNMTAKVITTSGEALLQVEYNDVKKTLNKVICNFILRCYQAAIREYNLYFISSSPTKVIV